MSQIDEEASDKIDLYFSNHDGDILDYSLELRDLVHECDLEMTEDYKWGQPVFHHKGLACSIGTFRKHVNLFFFKGAQIEDKYEAFELSTKKNSVTRSIKIRERKDIIPDVLLYYINAAAKLNSEGSKEKINTERVPLDLCKPLEDAFIRYPIAQDNYRDFSYSQRKEYIDWINSSKKGSTIERRISKAIDLLLEGRGLHDKYRK